MSVSNNEAVQGQKNIYSANSDVNAIDFFVRMLQNKIATAQPVKVVAVDTQGAQGPTGYVDVLPLVTYVDGKGQAVQPVTLYHLPYSRVQGGKAALIIDPVPDDIGVAVFAQSDSSNVTAGTREPQQPGSLRKHSQSDGFYIGGFLNQAPSCYLELTQDNKCNLIATSGVNIKGDVTVEGDVIANGISLTKHMHGGVESGGSNTSGPK